MARVTNTVSGNPASFRSPGSVPIRSLKIHFDPVQDFNGYGKPWLGGAGKNLLKNNRAVGTNEYNGLTVVVYEDGHMKIDGTATITFGLNINTNLSLSSGSYVLSGCASGGSETTYALADTTNSNIIDFGSGCSFTLSDSSTLYIRIVILSGAIFNNAIFTPMIRKASETDDSWEPYENICPITGWTGISYNHSNKNILPAKVPADAIKGTFGTGSTSISSASNAICFSVYVGKNRQLKFSKNVNGSLAFAFTDNKVVDRTQTIYSAVNCTNRESYTFNSGDHPWLLINSSTKAGYESFTDATAPMMRFGEDSTDYVPRIDWTPKSVNWTDKTVFGGYVDLVTGEISDNYAQYIITSSNYPTFVVVSGNAGYAPYVAGTQHGFPYSPTPDIINPVLLTNSFKFIGVITDSKNINPYEVAFYTSNNVTRLIFGLPEEISDLEKFLNFIDSGPRTIQLVYKASYNSTTTTNPVLTENLHTFSGLNKIWSNADNTVEAEYDYAESIDILKMRSLMIANAPHIETARSTSNVLSISPTVKNNLKECKVYFGPSQDGSGEPSPTNVRDFTGWSSIKLHNSDRASLLMPVTHADVSDLLENNMVLHNLGDGKYVFVKAGEYPDHTHRFDMDIPSGVLSNNMNLYFNSSIKHSLPAWSMAFGLRDTGDNNIITGEVAYSSVQNDFVSFGTTSTASGKTYGKLRIVVDDLFTDSTICPVIASTTSTEDTIADISWASTAGTLYGGYIDIVSGDLVATYKRVKITSSLNWPILFGSANYGGAVRFNPPDIKLLYSGFTDPNCICNCAVKRDDLIDYNQADPGIIIGYGSPYDPTLNFILFRKPSVYFNIGNTLNDFMDYADSHDIYVTYCLEEPIVYHLTPQTIMPFMGQNTFWSNANGGIEIKYWTH